MGGAGARVAHADDAGEAGGVEQQEALCVCRSVLLVWQAQSEHGNASKGSMCSLLSSFSVLAGGLPVQ